MLSRIAQNLFWIGRYVERAEDTARILDVHVQYLLEVGPTERTDAARALLAAMGQPVAPGSIEVERVINLLAFDPNCSGSITVTLRAAREAARGVREVLSSELWECINSTFHALGEREATSEVLGVHPFFWFVKASTAQIAGLVDTTMSRDDGWHFLVLGRSLERIDMTARLLKARLAVPAQPSQWVTTLRCASAYEAYLRTYHRGVEAPLVVEFLLCDRLFPRSAYHGLSTAESCLGALGPTASRSGITDEARRILGRCRTSLEFRRPAEVFDDLPAVLTSLERSCTEASDALSTQFFDLEPQVGWSAERSGARL